MCVISSTSVSARRTRCSCVSHSKRARCVFTNNFIFKLFNSPNNNLSDSVCKLCYKCVSCKWNKSVRAHAYVLRAASCARTSVAAAAAVVVPASGRTGVARDRCSPGAVLHTLTERHPHTSCDQHDNTHRII